MRQAGEFDHLTPKQDLVATVIDHQGPCPGTQEIHCMHPGPARLVIEDDDRWVIAQDIAAISPEKRALGLPFAWIQLLNRGFIRMQHRALTQQFGEAIAERFERDADTTHPVGQRRTGQRHPGASRLLFQTIERQVIDVLADHDPSQQGRRG
jgi:hypothetical protein